MRSKRARGAERALGEVGIGGHPASITALRNCRVRSFFGLPKSSAGGALLGDLAGIEEADAVGELLGEAHLVGDHQHGQVVLARRAGG